MDLLISLATVTLPILVQTVNVKTFALAEIVLEEEHVLMALILTPVSASLAVAMATALME